MRWRIGLCDVLLRARREGESLTAGQEELLRALVSGCHLKAHRHLDGAKVNRLHDADGRSVRTVAAADVARLEALGYIAGNMKFPASGYMLTTAGERTARSLTASGGMPVTVRLPDMNPTSND